MNKYNSDHVKNNLFITRQLKLVSAIINIKNKNKGEDMFSKISF